MWFGAGGWKLDWGLKNFLGFHWYSFVSVRKNAKTPTFWPVAIQILLSVTHETNRSVLVAAQGVATLFPSPLFCNHLVYGRKTRRSSWGTTWEMVWDSMVPLNWLGGTSFKKDATAHFPIDCRDFWCLCSIFWPLSASSTVPSKPQPFLGTKYKLGLEPEMFLRSDLRPITRKPCSNMRRRVCNCWPKSRIERITLIQKGRTHWRHSTSSTV